jgi:hypothetical protein
VPEATENACHVGAPPLIVTGVPLEVVIVKLVLMAGKEEANVMVCP